MASTKKDPIKVKDRKENGIELRKTHFVLGNDNNQFNSQYRNDFPTHNKSTHLGPNMDSVTLRKTHFKFGDYKIPYQTTTADHNKEMESGIIRSVATLDQNVKNDLRSSHFSLGNFEPNYNTMFRSEFYNKSDLKGTHSSQANAKSIERSLRKANYVLGNDVPDYKSETGAKYQFPSGFVPKIESKISSSELQKSHLLLGNDPNRWQTTSQGSYFPKEINAHRFSKDITRTNFIFGEDNPDFKSINQENFVPHKAERSNINKELAKELRHHHFVFGNDEGTQHLRSINQQDYTNQFDNSKNVNQKVEASKSRASNVQLGDTAGPVGNHYETTYGNAMKYNSNAPTKQINYNFLKSNFMTNSENTLSYATESRNNYGYKTNQITSDEIKQMKGVINDIRTHHWAFGVNNNDYATTTAGTYKYDANAAAGAKGFLDDSLKSDLRATHYKLGYMESNPQTTHQQNYVSMPIQTHSKHDPGLRTTNFKLNPNNRNVFEGKSIYMMDFNKRQVD